MNGKEVKQAVRNDSGIFQKVASCMDSGEVIPKKIADHFRRVVADIVSPWSNRPSHHAFEHALGALTSKNSDLLKKIVECMDNETWDALTKSERNMFHLIVGMYATYSGSLRCKE